jgi:hypothetical protein
MQRKTTIKHSIDGIRQVNETAATVITSSVYKHAHQIGGRGHGQGERCPLPRTHRKDVPPESTADKAAGAATEELASKPSIDRVVVQQVQ